MLEKINFIFSLFVTGTKFLVSEEGVKLMPCFSFCPLPGFKTGGFHYSKEDFKQNSFTLEDIFDSETVASLTNKSEYSITKTESVQIGICHTICPMKTFKPFEYLPLYICINVDINIYVHSKGSDIWFIYMAFALETPLIRLDSHNSEGIIAADLMLAETKTFLMDKTNLQCRHYEIDKKNHNEMALFDNCCKQQLWHQIKSKINCTIAGMSTLEVLDITSTRNEECYDERCALETANITWDIFLDLVKNTSSFGCPMPCEQISYKVDSIYYHKNNKVLVEGKFFSLFIAYSTLMVEERIETLNYDIASFLATAGGYLGLMLGFSFLSLLLTALAGLKKMIGVVYKK